MLHGLESSSTYNTAGKVMSEGASDSRSDHVPVSCMMTSHSLPVQQASDSAWFPWAFASGAAPRPCVERLLMQGIFLQQQEPKQLQELQM